MYVLNVLYVLYVLQYDITFTIHDDKQVTAAQQFEPICICGTVGWQLALAAVCVPASETLVGRDGVSDG